MAACFNLGHCRVFSLPDEGLFRHRHGHLHRVVHRQRLCAVSTAHAHPRQAVAHRPATQHGALSPVCICVPVSDFRIDIVDVLLHGRPSRRIDWT